MRKTGKIGALLVLVLLSFSNKSFSLSLSEKIKLLETGDFIKASVVGLSGAFITLAFDCLTKELPKNKNVTTKKNRLDTLKTVATSSNPSSKALEKNSPTMNTDETSKKDKPDTLKKAAISNNPVNKLLEKSSSAVDAVKISKKDVPDTLKKAATSYSLVNTLLAKGRSAILNLGARIKNLNRNDFIKAGIVGFTGFAATLTFDCLTKKKPESDKVAIKKTINDHKKKWAKEEKIKIFTQKYKEEIKKKASEAVNNTLKTANTEK